MDHGVSPMKDIDLPTALGLKSIVSHSSRRPPLALADSERRKPVQHSTIVGILMMGWMAVVHLCLFKCPGLTAGCAAQVEPPQSSERRLKVIQGIPADDTLPEGAIARLGTLECRKGAQGLFQFSPDGRTFYTLVPTGLCREWNALTGTVVREFHLFEQASFHFGGAFSYDCKQAVIDSGMNFTFYDLDSRKSLKTFDATACFAGEQAISPNGKYYAVNERHGQAGVCIWRLGSDERMALSNESSILPCLTFSPDSNNLLIADYHGTHCWRSAVDKALWHNEDKLKNPVYSSDGKLILGLTDEKDPVFRQYDATNGKGIANAKLPRARAGTMFAISPDNQTLAFVEPGTGLCFMDLGTGKKGPIFGQATGVLGFGPDGRVFVSKTDDAFCGWELPSGKMLYGTPASQGHTGEVDSLSFTRDGRAVCSARHLWIERFINGIFKTKKSIKDSNFPGPSCKGVSFFPDNETVARIVTGENDSDAVQIWRTGSNRLTQDIIGREILAICPDGLF